MAFFFFPFFLFTHVAPIQESILVFFYSEGKGSCYGFRKPTLICKEEQKKNLLS